MRIVLIMFIFIQMSVAELELASRFPKLTLVDQFDNNITLPSKGTHTIMFSFERDVSREIKNFLNTKNEGYLDEHNITYISDISGMPSFVTNWFALPKMKEFNFKIGLIYDKEIGENINREEGKVTLVKLNDNNITSIQFVVPKALNQALNIKD